jgi:predicted GNAT family acetyltransferase
MLTVTMHDARGFLGRAEAWLLRSEAEHNVILGNALLLLEGYSAWSPPFYLATVERGSEVLGCVMRTPPDGLLLTSVPLEALPTVAAQLAGMYATLEEAWGPEDVVTAFAELWAGGHGVRWSIRGRYQRYVASGVVPVARPAPGTLRTGEDSDRDRVRRWGSDYAAETPTRVNVPRFFETMLERRRLYLWDDGGPRSLATLSGFTPNGVRVSGVYTPPEFRNRRYASTVTAAVMGKALEERRFCVVMADLANPTSNGIYRKLGCRPLNEVIHVSFSEANATA